MFILALTVGTVLIGLMAGLFFGYACSVVPALGRVDDATYVTVMRRINQAIQNPAFGLCFLGALVLPAVAVIGLRTQHPAAAGWALAGIVAYLIAVAITFAANIPRNNRLERDHGPGARRAFEGSWNRYHLLRTAFTGLALVLLCQALVAL